MMNKEYRSTLILKIPERCNSDYITFQRIAKKIKTKAVFNLSLMSEKSIRNAECEKENEEKAICSKVLIDNDEDDQ